MDATCRGHYRDSYSLAVSDCRSPRCLPLIYVSRGMSAVCSGSRRRLSVDGAEKLIAGDRSSNGRCTDVNVASIKRKVRR